MLKKSFPDPTVDMEESSENKHAASVDISFDASQGRFGFFFTAKREQDDEEGTPVSVALEIRPNAEVIVSDQSIVSTTPEPGSMPSAIQPRIFRVLAAGLDITQDFDKWTAWIGEDLDKFT
jgi:hypothetical protein